MTQARNNTFTYMLIFIVVLAAIWFVVGQDVMKVALSGTATASAHAVAKHPEAQPIIDCINKNGPAGVFRDKFDKNTFFLSCQLPDGKWGFAVFVQELNKLFNKSAYSPGEGTWAELNTKLNNIANKYRGPLPPFGQ